MLAFMKSPQKPAPPAPPPDWSKEPGKVHFLTNETWDSFMKEHSSVLLMMFAPWCGYCKSMKPDYFKAAEILSEEHPSAALAAIDCTRFKPLCKQIEIKGFPTVKYFKNGEFEKEYEGDRSVEDLVTFMKTVSGFDNIPDEKEASKETEPEGLKILTAATFDSFLSKTGHVIVMFYAPWCGHCQNAKPKFLKVSEAFAEEPDKAFTAVDCTQDSGELIQICCDKQGVNGYPTIKYYRYGAFVVEYDGDRTEQDFLAFMKSPPHPPPPSQPDSKAG
ncbi:Protein disulfide-isomerase A5 [Desmophyllum pertusum]|uniref:Protein disulfide-isomerase A5 n=1 Tax=Desmophyllum pertusum TaxID=174260 RepID=A0A9X0A2M8_9CNID|nr:Protein disulfide-isomerase A5 [Desmophyllum pertusum]